MSVGSVVVVARLAICTGVTTLALVAGGCGGSDQTNTEKWADDVCSSINTWADTLKDARTSLGDTSNLSVSAVQDQISNVQDATKTLTSDLRDLGPPDTEAGNEAEQQINNFTDTLDQQNQVVSDAIGSGINSIPELLTKVSTITGALSAVGTAAQTAYDNIRQLNGAAELQDAFKSQKSCDQTRSDLSDLRAALNGSG